MTPPPTGDFDNVAPLSERGAWVFDLDNTLYPASCKLFAQIEVRIRDYVAGFLGLGADEAYRLQKVYFREHGTTLQGMMRHHGMDPGPFLAYVHDIDLSPVRPDRTLDEALGRLKGRKIVFTNGSAEHALKVIERVGVARHFEAVFDIAAAGYVPKPEPRVYDELVRRHGLDARTTVMVEDIARNLVPAARIGMTTVWVRGAGEEQPGLGLAPPGAKAPNTKDPAASCEGTPSGVTSAPGLLVGGPAPPDAATLAAIHHVVDDLALWLSDLTRFPSQETPRKQP